MTLSIITSSIPFTIATVKKGEYKLSVNGALDFETKNSYSFKVRVTDGVASDTADVVVKINDVNEKPVIADYTFNVDENSPKGKTVGTVKVKDVDTWTVMTEGYLRKAPRHDRRRGRPRPEHRWRRRPCHEKVGHGPRSHALYALVPAADRLYRRKARQLP